MGINWRSKAQKIREKKWNEALASLQKNREKLVMEAKINQIGIGFKAKKNKLLTEDIGVLFFVRKKLSKKKLNDDGIKPVEEIITDTITDVVEIPSGVVTRTDTVDDSRYEKLIGGISMIHSEHTGSGTLGIILRRKNSQTISIPAWVKNNAKWWIAGNISENEFVFGIQHLINVGIIKIDKPTISNNSETTFIPSHIKTTIGYWVDGISDDIVFANVIKFLIEKNIIKIPLTEKIDQEEFFALTNNHVGAKEDVAGLFPPAAKKGDDWLQPGFHGNPKQPDDAIGKLDTWNKILPDGPSRFNFYDVALAKISNQRDIKPYQIQDIGKVSGIEKNEIGDRVLKRGRKTGKTVGIVAGIIPEPQTIFINYHGYHCPFTDQLIIVGDPVSKPFSNSGDSGSLIVSEKADSNGAHKAKALLFSGGKSSSGIDYTFANPIGRIADEFQLEF